ncbi:MAG: sodium:solute symporter family protein, partial [Puniceicoccales bacterium]
MNIEYITLSLYLGVLLVLGMVFARFNKDLSDFVRGGGRGTWWLVGTSILMSGISAFTFTGNASAAYEAGPSLLVIYLANCMGFAAGGLFLGRWFRQTRAYTGADVVRTRYGVPVEQFSAVAGVFLGPFGAAIQLYALSLFASTVLNLPLIPVMVSICLIVVFYSTTGGKWAVMATDFVQALVMFVITALVFYLSLRAIGGFGEFFSYFKDPRFAEDFRFINDPGHFPGDRFTYQWAVVVFFMQFYGQISLSSAGRYIAARDGKEASRASWWGFIMMALGSLIWFVPPMVARFMFADEIMASGLEKPTETAYAFIAMKLLPNGMMGMMIAAMFAATMSSMDSGLNGQVGVIARNIIPRLRGALGYHKDLSPKTEIRICHIATLVLGALIICYALLLANQSEIALFDAYLIIGSVIGVPMGFPMLMGLWIKKLPKWSYFPIFAGCMIPSIWSFIDGHLTGVQWT